jgi:hypothetical protein
MAKKTAVKQLAKWLPLSAEFNSAVLLDGSDSIRRRAAGRCTADRSSSTARLSGRPDRRSRTSGDAHETQMISRDQIAATDRRLSRPRRWPTSGSQLAWLSQAIAKPVGALDELTAELTRYQVLEILSGA